MAKIKSETIALVALKKAEAYKAEHMAFADNEEAIIRSNAETRLESAKNRCQALITESEAESKNSNKMEGIRRHEEKIGAAEALLITGHNKTNIVISGKQGNDLMGYYTNALD